jgi:hypothetical protein
MHSSKAQRFFEQKRQKRKEKERKRERERERERGREKYLGYEPYNIL